MTATKIPAMRGRPRSFDAEQAVEHAMKLFHSRGYDAVGVAELVDALGIKPPSFYAAFGSKLGLLERALERYGKSEANVFQTALDKGGNVVEVVARTLENAARIYPESSGVSGCLVLDGTRNSADPEVRALGVAARRTAREAIRDLIATEYPQKAGELADLVMIALSGMSAAARDGADEATLARFAEKSARMFRREVGADDQARPKALHAPSPKAKR
jgi:TetR/AcrR family transcriptional regulator, repressor for divergent bdcA